MKKKETITYEYEHCGECPNAEDYFPELKPRYRCLKEQRRVIKDLWGEIPDWCPLETVDVDE